MIRLSPLLAPLSAALCIGLCTGCSSLPVKAEIEGYTIETRTIAPKPAVTTRKKIKAANLSAEYAVQIPKTYAYAQSKGGEFDGQPFAIYHEFGADEIDVEVGCPLKEPIAGGGDVTANPRPGGFVAVTSHFGSYHELQKAHAAMDAWMEKYGAEQNGPPWEIYISDPTTTAPDKVRTDVYYPIK